MEHLITKKELMALGYSEYVAKSIIAKAKKILVQEGFNFYQNRRIGKVPTKTVEKIIGTKLV